MHYNPGLRLVPPTMPLQCTERYQDWKAGHAHAKPGTEASVLQVRIRSFLCTLFRVHVPADLHDSMVQMTVCAMLVAMVLLLLSRLYLRSVTQRNRAEYTQIPNSP
jgi:hypothetical protein